MENQSVAEYRRWTKIIASRTKIWNLLLLLIGASIGFCAVLLGLSHWLTLSSIFAFVLLCVSWLFILKHMVRVEQDLKVKAFGAEETKITNPIYREIYEEYQYDGFEGVIGKGFFERWKLEHLDDGNQMINIVYTNKGHEIALTLSDDGVSIIIDEESDDHMLTIPLNDEKYKDIYVLFDAITTACRNVLQDV
ncbi:hypothetical protein SDC9_80524 [bioreactor metagenome]|uniref:Uncharacterized protein n=1 Tax=bioreactor metagenome TaxID=1076179 RepID=A0A644Z5D2_9ZZZZ|nr:hypothetical protein [Christensenella sp.]